ncbi:murein L,D-transpeptidase [Ktedonosporobacter rubrisoli]|uniref:Murein L,D-transpeptidase n=1 Tax=Ktedonosporobacter rubrisoli TaxID=2509675 RepID=A0A4P6JRT8_KTERU|nr:L,D-transpeptidase [Ktedonosporobacter rubrisoli]QBD78189.1 murein L,D-transpeptidase [Ktedonosporobacter rubrisoli]
MNRHQMQNHCFYKRLSTLLFISSTLCFLLLSGCEIPGSTNQQASSTPSIPTPIPTSTISTTLKNQADTQLQTFQQWISLMQGYHADVTAYQQQYEGDQSALHNALTATSFQAVLSTLNTHVENIKIPALKAEAKTLQQKLAQQVASWGQNHTYYDSYNGTTYPLGFEYGPTGIGSWSQDDLNQAKTVADYQQAIENLQMYLTNFQAMTTNSTDQTPYNQVHQTDLQLLKHYNKLDGKAILVSLSEEAVRIYNQGQLITAFLATTGQPDLPTPPGIWWIESKVTHTTFKTNAPKDSPFWYPPTPINYAMQYHSNGYFLHDSWWRVDYGRGTNFPHADASGNTSSTRGSHGCVNISTDNAKWIYDFAQLYTAIIIY